VLATWDAATTPTENDLVRAFHQFLASLAPLHTCALLIIDEAHHLHPDVLEQIRILSNFDDESGPLLQIVLVGQPQLEETLNRPELSSLHQRVARWIRLERLDRSDVAHYIDRRLWVAHGGPDAALTMSQASASTPTETFWKVRFSPAAIECVAAVSNGVPRVINLLCDRALERGYEKRTRILDVAEIAAAARQLKLPMPQVRRASWAWAPRAAAASLLLGVLAFGGWWVLGQSAPAADAPPFTSATSELPASDPSLPPTVSQLRPGAPPEPRPLRIAETFTISVASFRSEGRASTVTQQIAEMGLPAFRRWVDTGWHQIVVGPYASQGEAQSAQQRLEAAHFAGTRITSSGADARRTVTEP
jgi:general secretion pathway protein A